MPNFNIDDKQINYDKKEIIKVTDENNQYKELTPHSKILRHSKTVKMDLQGM